MANSFLKGEYNMIFTSYKIRENDDENDDLVMTSTSVNEQDDKIRYYATPLTKEIILAAIEWIRGGVRDEVGDKVSPEDDVSMEDLLQSYFEALKEHIPLQGSLELETATTALKQARTFISGREWPSEANDRKYYVLQVLSTNANDNDVITDPIQFLRLCNFVRRFIYDYVAKKTHVVGNIIDGLHRLTALESALIGFNDSRLNNNRPFGGSIGLPAAEFVIVIKTFIPTEEVLNNASFLENMKALSSSIQNSIGCLQPHKKKEFFAMMIQGLDEKCRDKYLVVDDDQVPTSIFKKIKYFSKKIIELICEQNGMAIRHSHMVPGMDLRKLIASPEKWSILFRKKSKQGKYREYSFLFNNDRLRVPHFISQHGNIRSPSRYSRGDFNAEVFELAQIMLWSRISKKSYNQLINLFTKSSISSVRQLTANDPDGTLMNQWISGLVDTVGTTVYYLYKLSVGNDKGKKPPDDGSHSEMLLMTLIEGVLEGTTEFFSKYGLDPAELPEWFTRMKGNMNGEEKVCERIIDEWLTVKNTTDGNGDLVKNAEWKTRIHDKFRGCTSEIWVNFLSFVCVSFALNLHSHILIKTGGRSKIATFEDLGVMESPSASGLCVLRGLRDTQGKRWTACISEYASDFEQIELDIQGTLLPMLVRTYLDSKCIPSHEQKKKNKETAVNVEPLKPSTEEYASMKKVIEKLKTPTVTKYLQDKLQACDDPVTKAKLQKLLTSIEEFRPTLLDRCYVQGVDQDDERGSSEDEERNAEYLGDYDNNMEDEEDDEDETEAAAGEDAEERDIGKQASLAFGNAHQSRTVK
ncbi:MAG: hypothetical protein ACKPB4_02345 [Sphaerospermopsis kisseleviana]